MIIQCDFRTVREYYHAPGMWTGPTSWSISSPKLGWSYVITGQLLGRVYYDSGHGGAVRLVDSRIGLHGAGVPVG